ncbi:MAG: radical SAM/SPASM domain-containing protein [Thermoguttaceae bacterium]|nr:radical SAM/SPASM domain-containing protein [Thermoguttaceae bacterium]
MFGKVRVLFGLAWRGLTGVSFRLLYKAMRLWVFKGLYALRAYRRRVRAGQLFPPFLFFAVTNACNLRCRGCWISAGHKPDSLQPEAIDRIIGQAAKHSVWFHTFLGGEPFLYPPMWDLIAKHPECYFQIITNASLLDEATADKIRALGNVTPLLSIDGFARQNDLRRGEGTFTRADDACRLLKRKKILYGVATVVTSANFDEVLSSDYVQHFVKRGAMYLWYYIFRPVGANPSAQLSLSSDQIVALRRKLLTLRKTQPIVLIDTYWDAQGNAVCPAAQGLGFHIGPKGTIEPCPPLSASCDNIADHDGDLFETINSSDFLRNFQQFVHERTKGCVILESPAELATFIGQQKACDVSGRDFLAELKSATPHPSHDLPGQEIPEDFWFYRFLKKTLFFGMGGYG